MKLRNIQLRSKEKSVKVQKKQPGAERMRKLREKKKTKQAFWWDTQEAGTWKDCKYKKETEMAKRK